MDSKHLADIYSFAELRHILSTQGRGCGKGCYAKSKKQQLYKIQYGCLLERQQDEAGKKHSLSRESKVCCRLKVWRIEQVGRIQTHNQETDNASGTFFSFLLNRLNRRGQNQEISHTGKQKPTRGRQGISKSSSREAGRVRTSSQAEMLARNTGTWQGTKGSGLVFILRRQRGGLEN